MYHQGSPDSAPEVILSAISQRTSKMRLGFAVLLPPIHHPLHVAAKVAALDLLSNGRVDLGIGRASPPHQLAPFGVELEDTRGMMNEAIGMIPRMWTDDVFSHEGRYYNVLTGKWRPSLVKSPTHRFGQRAIKKTPAE